MPQTVKTKLYYALVFPYLAYCNLVWASTYNSRLLRLITLQKRAIHIIAGLPYGSHTKQLFLDLNLLNVLQIRTYQLGNLCFVTIEVCCHPLIMVSSVMYLRFIHITLEIPQSIAAFLLAQTHADYPLDFWEFQ